MSRSGLRGERGDRQDREVRADMGMGVRLKSSVWVSCSRWNWELLIPN